jgi:hypothetical protein
MGQFRLMGLQWFGGRRWVLTQTWLCGAARVLAEGVCGCTSVGLDRIGQAVRVRPTGFTNRLRRPLI